MDIRRNFIKALREVRTTLNQIFLFQTMVDTLLVFLAIYLLLVLFHLPPVYAFFPGVIYLAVKGYLALSTNKPRLVEQRHASLNEKLRTAADNVGEDNPILQELETEVMQEMRHVGVSEFVNARGISYKILLVTVLSFGIIFTSTLDYYFFDLSQLNFGDGDRRSQGAGDFESVELQQDDDIYGEDDVAVLGDNELSIRLKPVDYKVSVKEEGDIDRGSFNDIYTRDAELEESQESRENIPKEQQELVKAYFKRLAESS